MAVHGFSANLEISLIFEEGSQSGSDYLKVINDQNAFGHGLALCTLSEPSLAPDAKMKDTS
jgi:hypothetical protein